MCFRSRSSIGQDSVVELIELLEAIHRAGWYHGDVRPMNMLLFAGTSCVEPGVRWRTGFFACCRSFAIVGRFTLAASDDVRLSCRESLGEIALCCSRNRRRRWVVRFRNGGSSRYAVERLVVQRVHLHPVRDAVVSQCSMGLVSFRSLRAVLLCFVSLCFFAFPSTSFWF